MKLSLNNSRKRHKIPVSILVLSRLKDGRTLTGVKWVVTRITVGRYRDPWVEERHRYTLNQEVPIPTTMLPPRQISLKYKEP